MMHCVTLLGGSNPPLMEAILGHARAVVGRRVGRVVRSSSVHYSEPWGFHAERMFANQALLFTTTLSPVEVLDEALGAEQEVGRDRAKEQAGKSLTGERYASREVDVDVMFYDDEVINTPRLTVPHPLLHVREFALQPLCEVMAAYRHPVLGRELKDIYEELKGAVAQTK